MITPEIIIRLLPSGQIAMSIPDDKMVALGMLGVARAIVETQILNPPAIIRTSSLPPEPPNNGARGN